MIASPANQRAISNFPCIIVGSLGRNTVGTQTLLKHHLTCNRSSGALSHDTRVWNNVFGYQALFFSVTADFTNVVGDSTGRYNEQWQCPYRRQRLPPLAGESQSIKKW
jgi:hypothetical protein